MVAWRSSEIAFNMKQNIGRSPAPKFDTESLVAAVGNKELKMLEDRMGPVALKLDESLNVSKLTGPEALQFMGALGIHIGGRQIVDDDVTQAYRNDARTR